MPEVNRSQQNGAGWQVELLNGLDSVLTQPDVKRLLGNSLKQRGIHLAVLVEPYLSLILQGKKTIESRFSLNRHAPYKRVSEGDLLLLKRSSGPIEGLCLVSDAWFYEIRPETWLDIDKFARALCMDDSDFWKGKRSAKYATLMRLSSVVSISPIVVQKADPRGWVTIRASSLFSQEDLF